jgi:hypothetical protein
MTRKLLALTIATTALFGALLGACGGSSDEPGASESQNPDAATLQAVVASYDLAVGPPRRFLVGLQLGDARLIGFGTIKVRVQPEKSTAGTFEDASFLAVPGGRMPTEIPDQPSIVGAATGRGVYATETTLSEPGLWTLDVEADVDGLGKLTAQTTFQVNKQHSAIPVGAKAPATVNPTMSEHGSLPWEAVDSRAESRATVPDPDLHQIRIPDALAAKRPMVITISTPVYCVSKFCGPITDMVATLAKEKKAQADFIHVEVWKDYDKQLLNDAAADWVALTPNGGTEPWVFVVGSDGIVKARFDNVVTEEELRAALDEYAK